MKQKKERRFRLTLLWEGNDGGPRHWLLPLALLLVDLLLVGLTVGELVQRAGEAGV